MRFTVQQVRNGCRVGSLTDLGPQPLATPLWMMYTLQGSAPYLTSDVLSKISDTPSVMIVPNGHVWDLDTRSIEQITFDLLQIWALWCNSEVQQRNRSVCFFACEWSLFANWCLICYSPFAGETGVRFHARPRSCHADRFQHQQRSCRLGAAGKNGGSDILWEDSRKIYLCDCRWR